MPIYSLHDIKPILKKRGRILGLDVGTKTIGLALSDVGYRIASPLSIIKRSKFSMDLEKFKKILETYAVQALVVGLPINMNGTEGPRCQSVRQFGKNFLEHYDLPLIFWDERWSTQAVTRTLLDADMSRARRTQVVDKLAAAYILQGALDALRQSP